uniref:Uncharacterized protein n=1 Tax=Oryza glaberrima TaxID=4538 RepID=I1PPR7_ORYGL
QESGGCPYIHFRLYEDCQRMTSSYVQMVSDIKRHVSHLSAAENQGVVPIISAGQIFPGPAAGEAYCKYKTLVLPSVPNHNMHFVVVLHTPPNWAGGTREPQPKGNKAEHAENSCQHIGGRPFPGASDADRHGFCSWTLWSHSAAMGDAMAIPGAQYAHASHLHHCLRRRPLQELGRVLQACSGRGTGFAPGTRGFATYESLIAFLGACLH